MLLVNWPSHVQFALQGAVIPQLPASIWELLRVFVQRIALKMLLLELDNGSLDAAPLGVVFVKLSVDAIVLPT